MRPRRQGEQSVVCERTVWLVKGMGGASRSYPIMVCLVGWAALILAGGEG